MFFKIKCLAIAIVLAFSCASGAYAQETGGVQVPEQPAEYTPQESNVSFWDRCKGFIGGACSAVTGVDPFVVSDSVDIVVESSEGIAETRDNGDEYFDAYPDAPSRERYTLETEDLSDKPLPGLYEAFWSLFE